MSLKIGDKVRKPIPDIVGKVIGISLDAKQEIFFQVEYLDQLNELQSRFFSESDLLKEPDSE